MKCKRCLNEDPALFYKGSKGIYCRKCVRFKRLLIQEEIEASEYKINTNVYKTEMKYSLTPLQIKACKEIAYFLKEKNNVFLHAVCGAGKTEICVPLISAYLKMHKRVGFAISRREVVIEISERYKKIFPLAKVIGVYGGHSKEIYGDLIVCTSHQLYRYYQYFDLLIIDEVDAFPFKGDEVLWNIAESSCKGNFIYSSATFTKELLNRNYKEVKLNRRPHQRDLVSPKCIFLPYIFSLIIFIFIYKKRKGKALLFVESRKQARNLYYLLSLFIKCQYITSLSKEKEKIINSFLNNESKLLIATSVLERGVTFKDIDVHILCYQNVFDSSALVQMCGRVDRDFFKQYGHVYIYSSSNKKEIKKCRKEINDANMLVLS